MGQNLDDLKALIEPGTGPLSKASNELGYHVGSAKLTEIYRGKGLWAEIIEWFNSRRHESFDNVLCQKFIFKRGFA